MTTISITRALAQVKSLNDRIETGSSQLFIATTTGGKHASGKPTAEVETTMKANLQSVKALIVERNKVKSAIVRSNAITKVTVAGVEMTVAEAIERKGSIQLEVVLLQNLKRQLAIQTTKVERENTQYESRLDELIKVTLGKERKVDGDEIEGITKPFEAKNKPALLDPNDLSKVIAKMENDIKAFQDEVDMALSEVNALTQVTI